MFAYIGMWNMGQIMGNPVARRSNRLSATKVRAKFLPGYYADGGGLYLQVGKSGSKSWVFRYQRNKERTEMGLGAENAVTLSEAREMARENRHQLAIGRNPLTEKRAALAAERGTVTFREASNAYITAHAPGWRNAKHAQQWRNTLETYAYPLLGDLPVGEIDTRLVLKVLELIWEVKTETATRLRGRVERILDWATVRSYRSGDNPARWRGHLDTLLAKPTKVHKVAHFAALPYADVPEFMAVLREREGVAARALAFLILTAARTSEVIGARWEEINGDTWTIPDKRIKAEREHRIPLPSAAKCIVSDMREVWAGEPFVFPGGKRGKPLSNAAMSALLKRMGRDDVTVHGFRSAFKDWCRERTNFPNEVQEAALAHVVGDKTERAYARGDLYAKRAKLMDAWARYCTGPAMTGEVVKLAKG